MKISAFVITYQRPVILRACLKRLRPVADELIVIDRSSEDNTEEVARSLVDRYERVPWGPVVEDARSYGQSLCTYEWIICLDDDELLSIGARPMLEQLLIYHPANVYGFPIYHLMFGRWTRELEWRLSFYRQGTLSYRPELHSVPDSSDQRYFIIDDSIHLLHLSTPDVTAWIDKVNRYTDLTEPLLSDRNLLNGSLLQLTKETLDFWFKRGPCVDQHHEAVIISRALYAIVEFLKLWERYQPSGQAVFDEICQRIEEEASMRALSKLFVEHDGYISDKWSHYISIYESVLNKFITRNQPISLLEIGVQNGGSLQIWAKYLPVGSTVVGIDSDPACAKLSLPPNVRVAIVDATDVTQVGNALGNETFDVIIDDGSHFCKDVVAAFEIFFRRVRPGGYYVIEDLCFSYESRVGGGLWAAGSAIEWLKSLIDALNADYFDPTERAAHVELLRELNKQIAQVAFFDSMVVIQKLLQEKISPYSRFWTGREGHIFDLVNGIPLAQTPELKRYVFFPVVGANGSHDHILREVSSDDPPSVESVLLTPAAAENLAAALIKLSESLVKREDDA